MPRIDETLDSLGQGVKYLSKIDCKSAFWLIPVAPEDRAKTAFTTKEGLFEFVSMPFGLRNAPATLQRFVNTLLQDLIGKCCVIYLDDCLIYSRTFEDHLAHLKLVLERFRAVGFKANPAKCELCASEVLYLGYIITPEGIRPNPCKVGAVLNAAPPTNVTEVRSFLGLANYYRRFLPNMASISAPLTRLTKKGVVFHWTADCHASFQAIKAMLVDAPLLRYPDFSKAFTLYTDWQPGAAAAILGQELEDGDHVIAYASKTLHGAELNYSPTDGELLAIVWAVKLFRPYLYGVPFTIVTDHKALKWLLTTRNLSGKLARYAIELQEYDFDIQHRAGSLHGNVDCLSRLRVMPPQGQAPNKEPPPENEEHTEENIMHCCYTLTFDKENMPPAEGIMELDRLFLPPTQDATQREDIIAQQPLRRYSETRVEHAPLCDLPLLPETLFGPSAAPANLELQNTPRHDTPPLTEDVPCQVCTGRDDEETMLLCDLCNHGYHIDCLEPALARVPRGPWLCPLCDQVADAVPTRDIVDDEDVLDYLAADKRHRPGTSRKDAKRIACRARNYYFAAEVFPIEWRTRAWPLVRKATRGFGPRTVPWVEDRLDIIKELHDDLGHYGVNRTIHLIKERFYWTDMSYDVRLYIQHCPGCQFRSIQLTKPVELTPVAVTGVFHMIGVDLTGPMDAPIGREKIYIATAIDYLTKWVEAKIIPNKEATTTANFFKEEILARHGCPQIVITDNGQEWQGAFQALMDQCCIEVRKTSPYHPQANGLVERFHGTLKEKLGQAALECPGSWDRKLPDILLGYRTSPQGSTKHSPFQLLYGRAATLPIDNKTPAANLTALATSGSGLPRDRHQEDLAAARTNITHAQERQKREYEKRMKPTKRGQEIEEELRNLQPGDLIAVKNRKKHKLATPFVGPFVFKNYHDESTLVIENSEGRTWKESIHTVGKYHPSHH
jgi:transposase InsO family protein